MVLTTLPPTDMPMCALSVASLIIASSYNKYSKGNREHPCLTPLPIEHALDRQSYPSNPLQYSVKSPPSLLSLPNQMLFRNPQ